MLAELLSLQEKYLKSGLLNGKSPIFKKSRGAGEIIGVRERYSIIKSRTIFIANVKPQELGYFSICYLKIC